ncbi:MAG: 4-hydroxy-3-methylbut-2-enyl diphosphate reductase [Spirochaetota bacterium]|nr:4-hydroxy-3-methylbut-2-enyl diphosphate reductase [Spirochaetota bacterium]
MNKREVIRADVLGFCMGVRAAMKKVDKAAEEAGKDENVYTFGPLIHNTQVLEDLAARGVGQINRPDEIEEGTVVIRAHGIERSLYERLMENGLNVIDGTCPRVLRSMRTVDKYSRMGWHIVLFGDAAHGEIKALAGYADDVTIVENAEQAAAVEVPENTMVISQTTVSQREYDEVCRLLREKNPRIHVIKSICPATQLRQKALLELAARVDAVVVIGGRHSSNTKRLYELAQSTGKPSWHIEQAEELPEEIARYSRIGITAGASTPDWIIDDVESRLHSM